MMATEKETPHVDVDLTNDDDDVDDDVDDNNGIGVCALPFVNVTGFH